MHVCKYLNHQRIRRIEWNGKSLKGSSKKNTKIEETEFHNSIQDWVFTTVYR